MVFYTGLKTLNVGLSINPDIKARLKQNWVFTMALVLTCKKNERTIYKLTYNNNRQMTIRELTFSATTELSG